MPLQSISKSRLALLFICCCWQCCGWAVSMNDLVKIQPSQSASVKETSSGLWFSLYDKWISPVDGDRCRMRPSCSHYSREALTKHGVLKGMLMTLDRLQRCGYDLDSYHRYFENGVERFSDPVSANKEQGRSQ